MPTAVNSATYAAVPIGTVPTTLTINGETRTRAIEPWTTLLDLLREGEDLIGTKKGCDHGQCGACTVLVDGRRINSCLKLAVTLDGAEITTIEGLGQPGDLHPLQSAFCDHDAFQCGYCTPGQICSAQGLINEGKANPRGGPRADERQSVPVRRLFEHRRCGARRDRRAGMNRFDYARPTSVAEAVQAGAGEQVRYLAGGTNLIDLMKENVDRPITVIDINRLPLDAIEELDRKSVV